MRGMKGLGSEKSWPTLGVGGVPDQCGLEGVLVSVRRRVLGNCGSASENVTAKLATYRAEEANALLRTCYSLGTTRREIGLNLGVTHSMQHSCNELPAIAGVQKPQMV